MLLKDDVLAAVLSKNPLHGYVVAWALKLVSEIQLLTYSYTINTPLGLDGQFLCSVGTVVCAGQLSCDCK